MIRIVSIEVRGKSVAGDFAGELFFEPGLQVITGPNGFGKTLAAESIAWCLNLEQMLGRRDADPSFFPDAVLEELDLPDNTRTRVIATEARLTIERHDKARIQLTRSITHDQNKIRINRFAPGLSEASETITLTTGFGSLGDSIVGFQNYIFEWFGWPLKHATTFEGKDAFVYLENLAPLFYIEQEEGWTEIQARQIGRYAQQQIRELSVEYLLGATDAVDYRVSRQRTATMESALREHARGLADRAAQVFLKQGWAVDWTGNGSVQEIEARWAATSLREALLRDAEVDLAKQRAFAAERLEVLRRIAISDPVDPANMSAGSSASQLVVDLKQRRHNLNLDLSTLSAQLADHEHLLDSLNDRIRTSSDVHRLKTTGVGRLAHLECPTCHRELEAEAFKLYEHTAPEVEAHIEALKRDRLVTRQTLSALQSAIRKTESSILEVDRELHNAQRTLEDVNAAVGSVREQIVRASAQAAAQERVISRLDETSSDLDALQEEINSWLAHAREARDQASAPSDLEARLGLFNKALGDYLVALGHSAATTRGVSELRLDAAQYEPYLDRRRLRHLGSGSDPARLVAAYTLALAAAAGSVGGLHPGVVILDEPLQQNPDTAHVKLFLDFLSQGLAKGATFQTLIFTFLTAEQIAQLRANGTNVITVEGHFLKMQPPPVSEEPTQVEAVDSDAAAEKSQVKDDGVADSADDKGAG